MSGFVSGLILGETGGSLTDLSTPTDDDSKRNQIQSLRIQKIGFSTYQHRRVKNDLVGFVRIQMIQN